MSKFEGTKVDSNPNIQDQDQRSRCKIKAEGAPFIRYRNVRDASIIQNNIWLNVYFKYLMVVRTV